MGVEILPEIKYNINIWPCPNYGYADSPPPPSQKSGHLDIKDAQ